MLSGGWKTMRIDELLDQPHNLPAISHVVQRLIESFTDEDITAGRIAVQIETDPALSAKLLRLANSAFFNVSRTVATVSDALNLLGFVMVRNLVLGTGLTAAFKVSPGMDAKVFWRYCLATACAARWLAPRAREDADLAFTAGLMHGVGHFILHAGLPGQMAAIDQAIAPIDVRRAAEERRRLGYDFAQVGAQLARRWRFPESIAAAMESMPAPLEASPFVATAAVVHLAAWRVRRDLLPAATDEIDPLPAAVCGRLALPAECLRPGAAEGDDGGAAESMPAPAELTRGLEAMAG